MRGATQSVNGSNSAVEFQSTLLMRGATANWYRQHNNDDYFNPRSSCEERHEWSVTAPERTEISIHAPHARSDKLPTRQINLNHKFQSTLLMRGATCVILTPPSSYRHFNPRSSCEERRTGASSVTPLRQFQSTLLMRGATCMRRSWQARRQYFNPRSSCEERRTALAT